MTWADHVSERAASWPDRGTKPDRDRFHLVQDVVDRVPNLGSKGTYLKQQMRDKLIEHKRYIARHGEDLPEIRNWKWMESKKPAAHE